MTTVTAKRVILKNLQDEYLIPYTDQGGGGGDPDEKSITKNSDEKLQTVGVIDSNNTTKAIKTWTGTRAQYDAITTKDPDTLYNITDDSTNDNIILYTTTGQNTDGAMTQKAVTDALVGVENFSKYQLFDIVYKDHVLNFGESLGFAPLGTYVYKEAIAGTRYGYPDFYAKCVDEYNDSSTVSQYLSSNVSITGSLTDNDGVLSGFSTSNYASVDEVFAPSSNPWEVVIKTTTGNDVLTGQSLIEGSNSSVYGAFDVELSNSKFLLNLSSNGTSPDIASGITGTYTILTNTTYYVKLVFTGTQYILSYSIDGTSYTDDITITNSTPVYQQGNLLLGIGWTGTQYINQYAGNINLEESYINIDGERWWTGTNRLNYKQYTDGHRFYDIADKATFDNMFAITGEAWYYGVDTTNKRVFLPRSTRFKNGTTLDVGGYQPAGLPNILADFQPFISDNSSGTGAIRISKLQDWTTTGGQGTLDRATADFDASRSNPIYGASNTVEYSSTKLIPYMVVGNVINKEYEIDVTDITTTENDTLPLLHHIAADETLNHPSWLRSSGQWNSGNVYATVYNYLVNEYENGTEHTDTLTSPDGTTYTVTYRTVNGKKVVDYANVSDVDAIYSACGSAWYYVINQNDMTFRLPMSHNYECYTSDSTRVGLDVFAGLPNITGELSASHTTREWTGAFVKTQDLGFWSNGSSGWGGSLGYFDASRSNPIYGNSTTVTPAHTEFYLYFKVANAVQNLELLNAGKVMESLVTKVDKDDLQEVQCVIDTYENGTSWYRIWSDGWCEQGGYSVSTNVTVSLLKTYKDTGYHILFGKGYNNDTNTRMASVNSNSITTNSFYVSGTYNNTSGTDCYFWWRTCGYLAQGEY